MNAIAPALIRLIAVAALAAGLAGCAGIPSRPPEVSVSGIDIVDFGLLEQRFGLKLRLMNPNDLDIPITGLSFELEVNGQSFARGVSNQALTLPRFGEAILEVEAVSNLGRLLRQLEELGRDSRQDVGYRLHGWIATGSLGTLPFDATGALRLPRLPGEHRNGPPAGGA